MFATPAGRLILAQNAGFRRLVVVLLHRGHTYGSLQDIREEISGHVKDLAPDSLTGKGKVRMDSDVTGVVLFKHV